MAMLGFQSHMEFIVYITFMFFGLSIMMTANAIMSAPSFITEYYKFAQNDKTAKPEDPAFWQHVLTYFNVVVFSTQVITHIFMLTPLGRAIPLRPRLIVGLLIPFIMIFALLIVPVVKTTETGAKVTVLLISFVSGFSKTLCDSSTGALAGPFPTKFYSAVVWGLGVSGIISSIMALIIKGSMSNDFDGVQAQCRIYFGVASVIQLISCVLLVLMPYNPFAREYTAEFRYTHDAYKRREITGDEAALGKNVVTNAKSPVEHQDPDTGVVRLRNLLVSEDADELKDIDQVENITSTQQMLNAQILVVFKCVWPMLLSSFVVFFSTLLVFPGVFFAASTDNNGWYMTIIVAMFNLGDFLSRTLLLFKPLLPTPRIVLAGSCVRLFIIPLLVMCVRGIISSVAVPHILSFIWGLTNGYFGGAAMIYCTRSPLLATAGQRSLASIMASLSLLLGLFAGSSAALGIIKWLPQGG